MTATWVPRSPTRIGRFNGRLALSCKPCDIHSRSVGSSSPGPSSQAPVLRTGQRGADTGGADVVLVAGLVCVVVPTIPFRSWGGHGRLQQEARDRTPGQL